MSLLEALQQRKAKLNKVEAKAAKTSSASSASGSEIDADVWYAANLERWYPDLKDHTARTIFLELSADDARSLCKLHEQRLAEESVSASADSSSATDFSAVRALEQSIDGTIAQLPAKAAFVKLSCRSPKDATVCNSKMRELYAEKLKDIDSKREAAVVANDKLCALYQSHLEALRVTSGAQGESSPREYVTFVLRFAAQRSSCSSPVDASTKTCNSR